MPRPPRTFLAAEWLNLIVVSYHVPPRLLLSYLPDNLELDPIAGEPVVSLVAFEFRNTRVWGVRWPGFVNFPEWNLRFYARTPARPGVPARRGVIFIREFVPSRFVASMARRLYNEPYAVAPFTFETSRNDASAAARYSMRLFDADHALHATAAATPLAPAEDSTTHALIQQRWGFGQTRAGRGLCYEVTHAPWRAHEEPDCRVEVDWAALYGPEWKAMKNEQPFSQLLVEGSGVMVSTAQSL